MIETIGRMKNLTTQIAVVKEGDKTYYEGPLYDIVMYEGDPFVDVPISHINHIDQILNLLQELKAHAATT